MKGLISLAAIFALLALFLIAFPVYAQSWGSYKDAAHSDPEEYFSGNETTVYMYGTFTADTQYNVAYYEADTDGYGEGTDESDRLVTDTPWSDETTGELESSLYFPTYDNPATDAGYWHAVVYDWNDTVPDVYAPGDETAEADDSFYVYVSAIPEFPTVIAMIVAIGLSFGIYYWMRRRYHRQVVTVKP